MAKEKQLNLKKWAKRWREEDQDLRLALIPYQKNELKSKRAGVMIWVIVCLLQGPEFNLLIEPPRKKMGKGLNRYFSEKDIQMANEHMKRYLAS
jgi:hypothetical protein